MGGGLRTGGHGNCSDRGKSHLGRRDVRQDLVGIADACATDAPLAVEYGLLELLRKREQRLARTFALSICVTGVLARDG